MKTKQLVVSIVTLVTLMVGIFAWHLYNTYFSADNIDVEPMPLVEQMPERVEPAIPPGASSSVVATTTKTWQMTPEVLKRLQERWAIPGTSAIGTSTKDYWLGYSVELASFSITITSEPAAEYRVAAEKELLDALSITQEQACTLNMLATRQTELTDPEYYKNYQVIGLSFCPGSVSDEELSLPHIDDPF
jgi:hypothetical protein